MVKHNKDVGPTQRPFRPASTIEGRENQLVGLAVDLAEKQMREGTASSQVLTHYLKLGTVEHRKQLEKLENENELLKAKVRNLESQTSSEAAIEAAVAAFTSYSPSQSMVEDPYDDFED